MNKMLLIVGLFFVGLYLWYKDIQYYKHIECKQNAHYEAELNNESNFNFVYNICMTIKSNKEACTEMAVSKAKDLYTSKLNRLLDACKN